MIRINLQFQDYDTLRKAAEKVQQKRWHSANADRREHVRDPEKHRKAARQWKAENPGRVKEIQTKSRIKRKYGISVEQLETMRLVQQNACAICKVQFVSTPFVDHCHSTGKVRGLLCSSCNLGLGKFKDNSAALRTAASYLDFYNVDPR